MHSAIFLLRQYPCCRHGALRMQVTTTAICGSDLHLYQNMVPGMQPGDILGHEVGSLLVPMQALPAGEQKVNFDALTVVPCMLQFMGIVFEVGPNVKSVKKGDRVVACFDIGCACACSPSMPGPADCMDHACPNLGVDYAGLNQQSNPDEGLRRACDEIQVWAVLLLQSRLLVGLQEHQPLPDRRAALWAQDRRLLWCMALHQHAVPLPCWPMHIAVLRGHQPLRQLAVLRGRKLLILTFVNTRMAGRVLPPDWRVPRRAGAVCARPLWCAAPCCAPHACIMLTLMRRACLLVKKPCGWRQPHMQSALPEQAALIKL